MSNRVIGTAVALALLLGTQGVQAACDQGGGGGMSGMNGGQMVGTLLGAAGGGLLGSRLGKGMGNKIAIGAGVLGGGFLGNQLGGVLSNCQDQQYHQQAASSALETAPTGQAQSWTNPDTGASGYITPTRTFQQGSSSCREFVQQVNVNGQNQQATGVACRQPDGTWAMNSNAAPQQYQQPQQQYQQPQYQQQQYQQQQYQQPQYQQPQYRY
jgi:surface antigen